MRFFCFPNHTVRFGPFFCFSKPYGAVRCGFHFIKIIRCGAVRFFSFTVRCRLYFSRIVRCDAARLFFEQLFPKVRLFVQQFCTVVEKTVYRRSKPQPHRTKTTVRDFLPKIKNIWCIHRHHVPLFPPETSLVYQLCTNSAILGPNRHINRVIGHGPHGSTIRCAAFFSTDQLNLHRNGLPPYSTVRWGAVRCGAFFFLQSYKQCVAERFFC